MRFNQRKPDQLREIVFKRQYTSYAEGSVLVCYGNTKVLCNVSVTEGVPRFLKTHSNAPKKGWLTAEYSMLPRATAQRTEREATRGKQSGRTVEIQRLIGRALRNCVNLSIIGEHTLVIDCDVIQADGGTRTAAISGSCIALYDACTFLTQKLKLKISPFRQLIAAVSVGIYQDTAILDLDYSEDSQAETDMNIIMDEAGHFIELQATGEKNAFHQQHLHSMLSLGHLGVAEIIRQQKKTLGFLN